jgi:carbon-monoxide dehydrogenase small subunit
LKNRVPVSLKVNGAQFELFLPPWQMLLDCLRDDLGLTGAKRCCIEGQCGACTVLMDGRPVNSCLYLAIEAQGREILTIEGVGKGGELHPIQRAFVEQGAVQCGFCTPGLIIATKALLEATPHPSEDDVRIALAGHLCRCGCYGQITEAVLKAAQVMSAKTR